MRLLTLLTGGQFLTLSWWELSAYLFGFSSIIINGIWLLTTFREKPMPNGENPSTPTFRNSDGSAVSMPEIHPRGKRTVWIGTPLVLALGIAGGYAIRDHQLVKNTHTYFDVKVLEKYSETKYLLQPARMQPWLSNPCEPVDLTKGQTMKFYTFEQMTIPDCHRVKSFEFYANSKGERIDADADLQMR